MRDLSIVIVTHNSMHVLSTCLGSVQAHAGPLDMNVVVSDCGSSDGTLDLAHSLELVVLPGANVGFAGGCNRALRHPSTDDSEFVLFLNPDVVIVDGEIATLLERSRRHPERGIYTARQVDENGIVQRAATHQLRRRPIDRWLFPMTGRSNLPASAYGHEFNADAAIGAFFLVQRALFAELGLFDESFFLYEEENEFCLRAVSAGRGARYLPQLTYCHMLVDERAPSPWQRFLQRRAAILLDERRFGWRGSVATRSWIVFEELRRLLRPSATLAARRAASAAALAALMPHQPWVPGARLPGWFLRRALIPSRDR